MRLFARRRAGNVALVAAGIFLGAAGAALAARQVFVTNGELSGCAQREVGNLRLATPEHPCRPDEESVVWHVQGPAGPPGPRGEPGASGVGSLDAFSGTPCTIRGKTGVTALSPSPIGFAVSVFCLASDEFEPNDSRETARLVGPLFLPSLSPSIFPAGDEDWFAANDVRVSSWDIGVVVDGSVEVELYRDGALVANRTVSRSVPFNFFNPDGGTAANWLLHISGQAPTAYFVFAMPGFQAPPMPVPGPAPAPAPVTP